MARKSIVFDWFCVFPFRTYFNHKMVLYTLSILLGSAFGILLIDKQEK